MSDALPNSIAKSETDVSLQMAELIAVRTFMKHKVLDAIPQDGPISLQDLSKATGVQDSLLGKTVPQM